MSGSEDLGGASRSSSLRSDVSSSRAGSTELGAAAGARSLHAPPAGVTRMSIREEVAQQEMDALARKNDADFEALLAKARRGSARSCCCCCCC
jgi:hypothetical protein